MASRTSRTRRLLAVLPSVLVFGPLAGLAHAQSAWPDRPLRLVVGFPPGGGVDVMARIIAQPLGELLGRQIVIDNKPGAASNVGMVEVVKAPADGYTFLIGPTTVESANPSLYKSQANPATDLLPVAGVGRYQLHLIVKPGMPVNDVAELVAYAKANPGKVNYASAGAGTTPHLVSELFLQQSGIHAVHVPYRGSAPALQAVMAGEADFVMDPGIAFQHVRAGRVRMFAVASATRSSQFPGVPTMAEAGQAGIDGDTWVGIWAPRGTPDEPRAKLARALKQVLAQPEVKQKFQTLNGEAIFLDGPEYKNLLARETQVFSTLIRTRKILVE